MTPRPAQFPTPNQVAGKFVVLDPMNVAADSEHLYEISHRDESAKQIFRYLQRGPYENVSSLREFISEWCAKPDVVAYVVRDLPSKSVVGTLSLMNIRPEHGVAEIGNVWYSPAVQRTKINTESVYLLLCQCFDELNYRRIEWKCDSQNRPSGKAALRLGFAYEGLFRKHMIIRDQNRDSAWFSMLDDEWPARCTALRRWLYEDDSIPLSQVNGDNLPY